MSNPATISFRLLAEEWLGDIFAFDSRVGRTLSKLLRRPGALTVEYVAGRRASYVPPFRLFLFISVMMFLVLGLTPTTMVRNVTISGDNVSEGQVAAPRPTRRCSRSLSC